MELYGKRQKSGALIYIFSSLGPKSYFALDFDSEKFKRSSKGVQHRTKLDYEDYKTVLYSGEKHKVQNTSIRLRNHQMQTMTTAKIGLSETFCKAFVCDDRITVKPFKKFT